MSDKKIKDFPSLTGEEGRILVQFCYEGMSIKELLRKSATKVLKRVKDIFNKLNSSFEEIKKDITLLKKVLKEVDRVRNREIPRKRLEELDIDQWEAIEKYCDGLSGDGYCSISKITSFLPKTMDVFLWLKLHQPLLPLCRLNPPPSPNPFFQAQTPAPKQPPTLFVGL